MSPGLKGESSWPAPRARHLHGPATALQWTNRQTPAAALCIPRGCGWRHRGTAGYSESGTPARRNTAARCYTVLSRPAPARRPMSRMSPVTNSIPRWPAPWGPAAGEPAPGSRSRRRGDGKPGQDLYYPAAPVIRTFGFPLFVALGKTERSSCRGVRASRGWTFLIRSRGVNNLSNYPALDRQRGNSVFQDHKTSV